MADVCLDAFVEDSYHGCMNTFDHQTTLLRNELVSTIDQQSGCGEVFENGFSEGDMLAEGLASFVQRVDEGASVSKVIEQMADHYGALFPDGLESYGYDCVRRLCARAGLGAEFDGCVQQMRNRPNILSSESEQECSPGLGSRIRQLVRPR